MYNNNRKSYPLIINEVSLDWNVLVPFFENSRVKEDFALLLKLALHSFSDVIIIYFLLLNKASNGPNKAIIKRGQVGTVRLMR